MVVVVAPGSVTPVPDTVWPMARPLVLARVMMLEATTGAATVPEVALELASCARSAPAEMVVTPL